MYLLGVRVVGRSFAAAPTQCRLPNLATSFFGFRSFHFLSTEFLKAERGRPRTAQARTNSGTQVARSTQRGTDLFSARCQTRKEKSPLVVYSSAFGRVLVALVPATTKFYGVHLQLYTLRSFGIRVATLLTSAEVMYNSAGPRCAKQLARAGR